VPFHSILQTYLRDIELKRLNSHSTGELSLRDALSTLLNECAREMKRDVQFVGEGKKLKTGKRPDYTVTRNDLPIGYIEAEKWGADLQNLSGSAKVQNDSFVAELDNFLLTNHHDFRLFAGKKCVASVSLPPDGKDLSPDIEAKWEEFLAQFLSGAPQPVRNPRDLALLLSRRSAPLRRAALEDLDDPDSAISRSFEGFKKDLLPNVSRAEFADIYAQTLVYGLFAARTLTTEDEFSLLGAADTLRNIPLLASLFNEWRFRLSDNLKPALKEIEAVLKTAPIEEIRAYFQKRTGRADPMIDFYEPFLAAYSGRERELRGVYYTPEPVVGYIVRSVAQLLARDFARPITDKSVQILDPATGTGSFLFAVLDEIYRQMEPYGTWKTDAYANVLPRLFGLELMVAPYTIAHLKLGLQLEAMGTPLKKRLNIFLSNTLDDPIETYGGNIELAHELQSADDIKEKHKILVVLGNPPYSGHSANVNFKHGDKKQLTQVGKRLERYKTVDGAPLGEKNPKWLNDDYVKFIAFAQNRVEKSGEGIVALITNHGFLDNPTFRGMRASLLDSFDALYLLDLHGNAKKKEVAPDGGKDENVFEIQQGVSILLAVKYKGEKQGRAKVFHSSLWGTQATKYAALDASDVTSTTWEELTPKSPLYLFTPRDETDLADYEKGWKVTDIFPVNVLGFQTHRDNFAIAFEKTEMERRAEDLLNKSLSDAAIAEKYKLKDNRDWQLASARRAIQSDENWIDKVGICDYRPFDQRACYFSTVVMDYPRRELIDNVFGQANLVLNVTRQTRLETWANAVVSKNPAPALFVEIKDGSNAFPLYLYQNGLFGPQKRANISDKFIGALNAVLGIEESPTPEAIFNYIYARLHGPKYRARYAAFLKTDFPRVPLPASREEFEAFARLGGELVALHTLDSGAAPVLNELRFRPTGDGDNTVERVGWDESAHVLRFNASRGFSDVPRTVWEWKIGGYQVAKKWLDDRKGRTLGYEELAHFQKTLIALDETRRVMSEIETLETD